MKAFSILFLLLMALSTAAICQSIPIGAMPMQYNGSFAGSAGDSRISSYVSFSGRNSDTFRNRSLVMQTSFDRFYPGIRSGIGISLFSSSYFYEYNAGLNPSKYESSFNGINLDIAPKISIKGKYTLSPSLGILYGISNINRDPELSGFENGISHHISAKFGLLFNTDRYYLGYTMGIFSGDFESISFRSYRSQLQFGYTFQRNTESKFSFTPQIIITIRTNDEYKWENIISYPTYNLGFRYGQFLAGILGSNEFIPTGFQIGWQRQGWRFIYYNEFQLDNYYPSLSLRYIFNHDKKSIHIYDRNF